MNIKIYAFDNNNADRVLQPFKIIKPIICRLELITKNYRARGAGINVTVHIF